MGFKSYHIYLIGEKKNVKQERNIKQKKKERRRKKK